MVRPIKTFETVSKENDLTSNINSEKNKENKDNQNTKNAANEKTETNRRKPLIQLEPSCFYEDSISLKDHSSIPQGVELKKEEIMENNVELNSLEKGLQKIGIIPSDAWIAGKSKNLWVNLARNIVNETLGVVKNEEELVDTDYIIELPSDLAKLDNVEANYEDAENREKVSTYAGTTKAKASTSANYDLFYSNVDEEELDDAPSCCEVYK